MIAKPPSSSDSAQERYQAFIRNSSEGIWRFELKEPISTQLTADRQIKLFFMHAYLAEANDACAKMYGYTTADDIVGLPLNEFMLESDPENIAYLEAFIRSGYRLSGVESHETDNKGNDKYFRNSLIGVVEKGCISRAWGTQQDITEQRRATILLEQSEERLRLALQSSSMGLWEWDIVSGELYWSDELKQLFGLKPRDAIDYEKYLSIIHPHDRDLVRSTIKRHLVSGRPYQLEHRVIWPDGSTHWIEGKGRAYHKDGAAIRMIGVSTNIDDMRHANDLATAYSQLKTQRAQLVALNKTKDEFIALASHQLRTPATAVKQYIGLLLSEFAGPLSADQEQYLQVAFDSNERQLSIINDLLKTAQIDSSRFVLHKNSQNIADIVRSCVSELKEMFADRRQTVRLENFEDFKLDMDAGEMKLVIANLLENASKYSYPDTEITVTMKLKKKHLELSVTDQGVGIAEADTRRIFDKFTRVNNDLSDTVSGTGFGLYWVKRIIALHGGSITVRSKPAAGSTFCIKLPI